MSPTNSKLYGKPTTRLRIHRRESSFISPNNLWKNADPRCDRLEVPILFYPDADFQSADASPQSPQSWLEMPLRSDRPIPFRCAVGGS